MIYPRYSLSLISFSIILKVVIVYCDFSKLHNIDFKPHQFLRHRTDVFYKVPEGLTDVIVRRGEMFEFALKLGKNYNNQKIQVHFQFKTNKDVYSVTLPSYNQQRWSIKQIPGKRMINVNIYIHEEAPVGVWQMFVALKDRNGNVEKRIPVPNRIIVLFNPWSHGKQHLKFLGVILDVYTVDAVFMPSDVHLEEYVMNEKGILFSYNWHSHKKRLWLFNQFKLGVLDAVLFIMNKADLNSVQRGDPVRVVRDLSWLLNVGESMEGVLRGKWSEPYDTFNGRRATRPTDWMSSDSILYQYFQTNGQPVAYGQCWVFAGLFTTILRALGIPARAVSSFGAAHDFDGDLTVDVRFDDYGFLNQTDSDRIWNFHVWTQAWMSRKHDLKSDAYNGWQNVDATPQGIHAGRLQVGPASTAAVKDADVRKPYETAFVYMEQNSDEVHWQNYEIKTIKRDSIGLATVTKAVGSDDYEDITHYFKHEEKTAEERDSYRKACSGLGIDCVSLQPKTVQRSRGKDVTVSIDTQSKMVWKIGQTVKINLILYNPSFKDQLVDVAFRVTSTYYDGVDGSVIKNIQMQKVLVRGDQKRKLKFEIVANEYIDKLKDFFTSRVEAVVTNENGHIENDIAKLVFLVPPLRIDCPPKAEAGQYFTCIVDFINPLKRPLEDCYFMVEGQRVEKKVIKLNTIEPGEESSIKINLMSQQPWHETIVASFVSRTVKDVRGSAEVHIVGNSLLQFMG